MSDRTLTFFLGTFYLVGFLGCFRGSLLLGMLFLFLVLLLSTFEYKELVNKRFNIIGMYIGFLALPCYFGLAFDAEDKSVKAYKVHRESIGCKDADKYMFTPKEERARIIPKPSDAILFDCSSEDIENYTENWKFGYMQFKADLEIEGWAFLPLPEKNVERFE